MASVLDLVKHYQHSIEKYPSDEQKVSSHLIVVSDICEYPLC